MTTGNTDLTIRITGRLDGAIRDIERLESKLQGATRGFNKLRSSAVAAGGRIRSALGGLGAAVGAGGTAFGDFEATLTRIVGLVGVAKGEVDAMGQALLRMGPEVGRGPNELARALYAVTRAGARGELALDIVRQAARAAAAGLGETAAIAGTVESAIDAYGEANLDAGTAAGILVAAARESGSAAAELAPAMGRMLPVAAQLGVEFHQVAGAAVFLAESGLGADRAVTAMHSALEQILEPTDAARQAAAEIGLSFEELQRVLREEGLPAALRLIRDAAEEDSKALERLFPDVESLVDVLTLVGPEAGEATRVLQTLAHAGVGVLDRAFGAVADTVQHQLNAAMAEFDAGTITEGGDILSAFADAARLAANNIKLLTAAGVGLGALWISGVVVNGFKNVLTIARFMMSAATVAERTIRRLAPVLRATPWGRALTIFGSVAAALWAGSGGADSAAAKTGAAANAADRIDAATSFAARRERIAAARAELAIQKGLAKTQRKQLEGADEAQKANPLGGTWLDRLLSRNDIGGHERKLKAAEARIQALRRKIAELSRPGSPPIGSAAAPAEGGGDTPAAADLRRPRAALKALRVRYEDELLALQGKRIELERRNEERALAEARALLDAGAKDEEEYSETVKAIRAATAARIAQIRAEDAADAAQRREEERNAERQAEEERARRFEAEQERAREAAERAQRERERDEASAGAGAALRRLADEADDTGAQIGDAVRRAMSGAEDAFVQLASTGKLSFRDLTQSILADLTRIAVRQSIVGPLASGLFGALGLGGPAAAPAAPAGPFALPAGGFRFHRGGIAGGLRPNEVPAILTRGEGVFTPEQMRALAPAGAGAPRVDIRFENRGTPQREVARRTEFDGRDWVIAVVVEDVEEGGPFSRALSRNLGGATG